ncbi:RNA methyltransferase [Latilactobacillus curvatus]|uniref:TrmH family RNA methyltransferase n=1 Tax=Latilactobacillus curvatus TaxID=28038 RepID=UPI0011BBB292|nr:RNA methyltransferase [Latilactobacillus curvatus]QEA48454.1 RNA methyltransferase [Latilactobacillus curvatus]
MEYIQSNQNTKIKAAKKLTVKKNQRKENTYLLEGWHLVQEAIQNKAVIRQVFATEKYVDERALRGLYDETFEIAPEVAQHLSETKAPQGIFAVVEMSETSVPEKLAGRYLLLDAVQDPGNIGTMIRTADAADFAGVVLGNGSVDLYNPKLLRSMQGSHFHLPIYQGNLMDWMKKFNSQDVPVYGTELNPEAISYQDVPKANDMALILGNEGNGVNENVLAATTQNIYIPIPGNAESLNVAVAAGILMFKLIEA